MVRGARHGTTSSELLAIDGGRLIVAPGLVRKPGLLAMVNSPHRRDTDVFIVGGGPAGLAAGIAARRRGFQVMLADSAIPPIDKPCGEGLMPDGICALSNLGIAIPAGDSVLLSAAFAF